MIDIAAAVAAQVARFAAAGITATADPRNVNAPALLVLPPVLRFAFANRADAVFTGYIIGIGAGVLETLESVSPLLDAARKAVTALEAFPMDSPAGDSGNYRPTYSINWTVTLKG